MKNIIRKTKKAVHSPGSLLARLLAVRHDILCTHFPYAALPDL